MLEQALSKPEKKLVMILRWWAILFTLATAGFIFLPDTIFAALNKIGRIIFGWNGPPLTPSTERFWLVLAVSLMIVLIVSAIKAQKDIVNNLFYVKIILISKLASTTGFLAALILVSHAFGYLAGAIIDGSIFIITFVAYRKAAVRRYGN